MIEQIYDDALAQAGYIIVSRGEAAIIDPARDTAAYQELLDGQNIKLKAVVLTHPHADFVSGHRELAKKYSAQLYMSKMLEPAYEFTPFDTGDKVSVGDIDLRSLNTPGHSPDSISIVATDANGKDLAVFTGDTLFVGDVGRPDLRESAGATTALREELARNMYTSTRDILMKLDDDVIVYPAHGAGTLCGKNLSDERQSTIGQEKRTNVALQPMTEGEFVTYLTSEQPYIPQYFPYDVQANRDGILVDPAPAIDELKIVDSNEVNALMIDIRPASEFQNSHLPGAINIPAEADDKFETWLGSLVSPGERYYLVGKKEQNLRQAAMRAAKIGYEIFIEGLVLLDSARLVSETALDYDDFQKNMSTYTIVDVRNENEAKYPIFEGSILLALPELRGRSHQLLAESTKPIVFHCAGGYRSAVAASIVKAENPDAEVYDLGDKIGEYIK